MMMSESRYASVAIGGIASFWLAIGLCSCGPVVIPSELPSLSPTPIITTAPTPMLATQVLSQVTAFPSPSPTSSPYLTSTSTPAITLDPTPDASQFVLLNQLGRGTIEQLALSMNGETLAVVGSEGVRVYKAETLQLSKQLNSGQVAHAVAWNGVGQLAVGYEDGTLDILDPLNQFKILKSLNLGNPVERVAWSQDSAKLAVVVGRGAPASVKVIELATDEVLWTGFTYVISLAWSPDGTRLALGLGRFMGDGTATTVAVVDGVTGQGQPGFLTGSTRPTGPVHSLAWSPDGKRLASGNGEFIASNITDVSDFTARIWDVASGQPVRMFRSFADSVKVVVWSPDGKMLVTGTADAALQIWDIESGQVTKAMKTRAGVAGVAWLPNGKYLIVGCSDGALQLWNATSGNLLQSASDEAGAPPQIWSVAWSPDGAQVALGGQDGTVRIWDTTAWKETYQLSHGSSVKSVAWSQNGTLLASGGEDGLTQVWNWATKKAVFQLPAQKYEDQISPIFSLAWAPDSKRLAVADWGSVRIVDSISGHEIWRVRRGGMTVVGQVAWSPDGKWLAINGEVNVLQLWDSEGRTSMDNAHFLSPALSLAWSPDSKWVFAGGSFPKKALKWNIQNNQTIELLGRIYGVETVAWSPNGKWVALGDDASSVQIWSAETGQTLKALQGHTGMITCVAWSPDSTRLISSSEDGTVRVWGIPNR
jgi:WD40 repeat protein